MSRKKGGAATGGASSGGGAPPEQPQATKDPIVLAAQRMIVDIFAVATAQVPELLNAQTPGGVEIQKFTDAMLAQLQAQVTRALGIGPDDGGGGKP
jgi:hypothetical protein